MKTKEQLVSLGLTNMKADEIMLLESKMMETAICFQYRKKDGSVRNAVGTLCRSLMKLPDGSLWKPKGDATPESAEWVRYFDMDQKGWRQFSVFQLIAVGR